MKHYAPEALVLASPEPNLETIYDRIIPFTQKPGEIIAVGLDANQHSRRSIASLQASLLDALENNTSHADYVADIPALLSHAAAKYWLHFNEHNEIITGLTHSTGGQQWVGSGIVFAKPDFLRDTETNSFLIDHLPYRIAPVDMGVDLPNINHLPFDRTNGALHGEAWQLLGYNFSALEHTIIEETITSPSISTVKGLQQAAQKDQGISFSGHPFPGAWDRIMVLKSTHVAPNQDRVVEYVEDWTVDGITPITNTNVKNITDFADFTDATNGIMRSHVGNTNLPVDIWNALQDDTHTDDTTVLVPFGRTKYGEQWLGGVYVAETPVLISQKIEADDSPSLNGSYSDGSYRTELALPTFNTTFGFAGDPVNTSNGNMFRDDVDFSFPNLGVPLSFTRHYDSKNKDDIGLGVGWTYSFGDVLIADPDNAANLIWITSRGERHTFEFDGTNFKAPAALHGQFSEDAATYFYKDKSGMEHHFEKLTGGATQSGLALKGRLLKQIDNIGNGVMVTYDYAATDTQARVRRISSVSDVHDFTRRIAFNYNSDNTVSDIRKITQIIEDTWVYSYQFINGAHLQGVIHPLDNSTLTPITAPLEVSYEYYQSGLSKGLMKKITELNDGADLAHVDTHEYKYFPNGRVFSVTDGEGHVQTFNYNLYRNLTEFTDENGNTEIYIHQDNGLTSKQIHADRTHQEFTWGAIDTDEEFLMTSSTDEVGAVEKFTYFDTSSGFKYRELQQATSKHYVDADGNPLPGEIVVVNEFDYSQPTTGSRIINLASTTVNPGPNEITTTFTYDNKGRLLSTTDALGNVTTRSYYSDADATFLGGLLESETSPRGNDTNPTSLPNQEFVYWGEISPSFTVTGDTLSVHVSVPADMPPGRYINVDAIRIERLDGDFPDTRIINVDNDSLDDEFSATGTATYSDNGGAGHLDHYKADRVILSIVGDTATWKFSNLASGAYRVLATWHHNSNRWSAVPYQVFDGTPEVHTNASAPIIIDQTQAPTDIQELFKTVFTYDSAGNVTSAVTDGLPASTNTYDHHGNVLSSFDPAGVESKTIYDILGRQRLAELVPAGTGLPLGSSFAYDSNSRLQSTTDPLGRVTRFEYDTKGNVVKQIYPDNTFVVFEYDGLNNVTRQTDELSRTTRFHYDSRNRLIETIHPDGAVERVRYNGTGQVTASVDALGRETKFAYDAAGRLLRTENPAGDIATNVYDSLGRLQSSTDFKNQQTEFKYDDLGRVIETRGPVSSTTGLPTSLSTTDYDAAGNVKRVAVYDLFGLYDLDPLFSLPVDPRDLIGSDPDYVQVTETRYDSLNRPNEVVNADGTSTQIVYDNVGRIKFTYDELGRKTESTYDQYGRLASTILPDPDGDGPGNLLTSPVTRFEYDAAGNQTAVIDPNGNKTTFEYDVFDRVVTTLDAEGGETRSLYDVAGQLVAVTDALGRAGYTLYDKRGRQKKVRTPDPDGNGPQLAAESEFKYDAAGNLIEQIDPRGYKTTFEYDELNRLVKESFTETRIIDDQDGKTNSATDSQTVYRWAPTETNGLEGSFGHDATTVQFNQNNDSTTGLPQALWYFRDLPAGEYRVAFTWDAGAAWDTSVTASIWLQEAGQGNVIQKSVGNIDQTQAPDDFVRPFGGKDIAWKELASETERIVVHGNGATLEVKLVGQVQQLIRADAVLLERVVSRSFTYDANGNLASETDTLGHTTDYTYDELDRVKTVALPDPVGLDRSSQPLPRPLTTTHYDGYGNVARTVEDRGGQPRTTAWTYDARNRVLTETLAVGTPEEVATKFTYDAVGNLTEQIDDFDASGGIHAKTVLQYDNLNREILRESYRSATDTIPLQTFSSYDSAGNLSAVLDKVRYDDGTSVISTDAGFTEFVYDKLNRQTAVRRWSNGPSPLTTSFEYDAVGNLLSTTDPLQRTTTNTYDRQNRLLTTTDPDPDGFGGPQGGAVTRYQYDVVGNLIAQTNGEGETERFTYDNLDRLIRSYDALGAESRSQYDSEGNLLSFTDPELNTTNYTYDGLNRLTAETIELDGSPVSRLFSYDAQGNLDATRDRNSRLRNYNYDALDRLTAEQWGDSSENLIQELNWEYDKLGRVTLAKDSDVASGVYTVNYVDTFNYDNLGRITEQRNYDPNNLLLTTNPKVVQRYAYDEIGILNAETHVRTVYTQHAVDDLGAETLIGSTGSLTNPLGQTRQLADAANSANGIQDKVVDFSYSGDELTGIARTANQGAFRFDTDYRYDGSGRLAGIMHSKLSAVGPQLSAFTTYGYQYDAAHRITGQATTHDTAL
ncbi:MAG: DUF6531 domain-containing protein, partial [Pirellulales bacterium]|nr:DUF6531 domain-containing protein [Pirellulales bacterium]